MMADLIAATAKPNSRHGEAFWRDMIIQQSQSAQGIREFCHANGLAPSTFHKWRLKLSGAPDLKVAAKQPAPVSTAHTVFIPILQPADRAVGAQTTPAPIRDSVAKGAARESITVITGGLRVEMTGSYAERIVRHLLGRMNGFTC